MLRCYRPLQLLGMIAVGMEWSEGSVVDAGRSRSSQSEAYRVNYEDHVVSI
jgi:hypothetical protein